MGIDGPLREFVYLDAVSLNSLLVSQNTTIPEQVSEAITRMDEAELSSSLTATAGIAKGDIAARYQTSNSNNVQTSRKAIVQTLFKEFRDLPPELRLSVPTEIPKRLDSVEDIPTSTDSDCVVPATALSRGSLVEIEVTLAVDPIFKLSTMMEEWSAMADDYPAMFGSHANVGFLREVQPIMRVLDRFLAGLVPIKATATSHVVVEIGGEEFVVRLGAVEGLQIAHRPLQVAGVTEHLGYWKDIRRILFSDGRFTMLCRVARDGIHQSWTPVKLADVFSDVAPNFIDQINAIQYPSADETNASPTGAAQTVLGEALMAYKSILVSGSEATWPAEADAELDRQIERLVGRGTTPTAQRAAFNQMKGFVATNLGIDPPNPDVDLAARQQARQTVGLNLFPSLGLSATTTSHAATTSERTERIVDVEVIAIYW